MHVSKITAAGQGASWSVVMLSLLGFFVASCSAQDEGGAKSSVVDDSDDPFADPFVGDLKEEPLPAKSFKTNGGYDVKPWVSFWEVEKGQWPKIAAPITFSYWFTEPKAVWRTEGGFFASFNAGEFGAGLFYADQKAKKWNRLFRAHVESLFDFGPDVYVAVGGLAHLTVEKGEVYHIARAADGSWDVKLLFESRIGVPKIVGESMVRMSSGNGSAERVLVFVICSHGKTVEEAFGVSKDGIIYFLGARDVGKDDEK